MTLIWAEGQAHDRPLAPLWRRVVETEKRRNAPGLSAAELGQAMIDATAAKAAYDDAVQEADDRFKANPSVKRTHAVIVGVGRYTDTNITAVSTSVYGAQAFAEWLLTSYRNEERALGSVELLLSPAPGMADWRPSNAAAASLGLAAGDTLPVETAAFNGIQLAFEACLGRCAGSEEHALFFYFAGHGIWRSTAL